MKAGKKMEKDIDIKLYNEYLQGKIESFELLYNKYKSKIQYFVFNIVKDYEKAEDITQEVFMYILKNNFKQECSFKCYIYIIAKSRAINYLKNQERKKEIDEKYLLYETNLLENDIADTVERNETRKNVINAINLLDDKYKNAIYLVKIEGLSYKETAKILGEKPENVKNLVHRGKKNLRKIF